MQNQFNFRDFLYPLQKRWYFIVVFVIVGLGLAYYQTSNVIVPKVYQTKAQILIPKSGDEQLGMLSTYTELLMTDPIVNMVKKDFPELQSLGNVSVAGGENSRIITISGSGSEKEYVVKLVNRVAEIFAKELPKLVEMPPMKVFSPAKQEQVTDLTTIPDHTRTYFVIVLGAFILSLFPIYLIDAIKDTLRTEEEIEAFFDAPILGSVKSVTKMPVYHEKVKKRWKRGGKHA